MWPFQLRKLEKVCGVKGLADQLEEENWVTVFDALLVDVRLRFPWYTFSGGVHAIVGGVRYRLSFGRPPNNADPSIAELQQNLVALTTMRSIGKQWRAIAIAHGVRV